MDCIAIPPMGPDISGSEGGTVSFLDTLNGAPETVIDFSADCSGGVKVWAEPNGGLYDAYEAGEGGVYANPDSRCPFYRSCSR